MIFERSFRRGVVWAGLCGLPISGVSLARAEAGIQWVSIPGGIFMMGAEDRSDAKPIHRVRIKPFELAKTAVTNKQYGA
ncbi:MAG: SUMF1/EgtB/PvdO family nonheme iron enzyme, partial [Elusimicrobiota bacterium]